MKKISIIIVLLLLFFINNNNCMAESFIEGPYIDDAYIKKELDDLEHHLHSQFVYKDSDEDFVYCIDPFEFINTEEEYDEHESKFTRFSGLDEDTWPLVVAAAYLGYMHGNHTDPIWYSVTQVVIWQIVEPEADIYFTDGLNGRRIHDYDDLIEELYDEIVDYFDMSEIPDEVYLNYNEMQIFELNDKYRLENQDRVAGIRGNELIVVGSDKGTRDYTIYKGKDEYVVLYTLDDAQNLIWVYDKPYLEKEFSVTTFSGNIEINLNFENEYNIVCNDDTKTMYGLYDENNHLIMDMYTAKKSSPEMAYGKYYIKQISNSCAHLKDENTYEVILDQDLVKITIDVLQKHKVLHVNHNICKEDDCLPEDNVTFSFEKNNEIIEYKTDSNGEIVLNTGDDIYLINQIDGDNNYTYSNNVEVNILSYNSDDVYVTLNGYLKQADIKVDVVDQDDNLIDNAKVCIYNDNNELIECKYSKKGEVIFEKYYYGKYKVVEEDINNKYYLNNEEQIIDVYEDILLKIINQKKPIEEIKQETKTIIPKYTDNNEIGNTGEIVRYEEKYVPNNVVINPETGDTHIGYFISIIATASIILKKLVKNS